MPWLRLVRFYTQDFWLSAAVADGVFRQLLFVMPLDRFRVVQCIACTLNDHTLFSEGHSCFSLT